MAIHNDIIEFFKGLVGAGSQQPSPVIGARSGRWPSFRRSFLKTNHKCEVCGGTTKLNVHHIVPFYIDQSKELDPENMITLCEGSRGLNCHFWIGHNGNWKAWNENVRENAKSFGKMLSERLGVKWNSGN